MSISVFNKKFMLAIIITLIAWFSCASYSFASVNQEEAQKLHSLFSTLLEEKKEEVKLKGVEIITEGDLLVETADNYYAVTYPHIKIKTRSAFTIDVGIIAMNVIPVKDKDVWKITLALPTPIRIQDQEGQETASLSIGKQHFSGTWNEGLSIFTQLKAKYDDINLTDKENSMKFKIAKMLLLNNLESADSNTYSGPTSLAVNDISVELNGKASLDIKSIGYNINIYDYDISKFAAYQEKMAALTETYENDGESLEVSPSHSLALYNLVTEFMGSSWDGFDFKMDIKDFNISVTEENEETKQKETDSLHFDSAHYGFGMTGFKNNSVEITMGLGYDQVNGSVLEDMSSYAPDSTNLALSISDIPYQEIVELGRGSMQSISQNPQMAQMAGMQALMTVPQLLTQAGTKINLDDLTLENQTYQAKSQGQLFADIGAVKGATGKGNTQISGLNELVSAVAAQNGNPETPAAIKEKLQSAMAALAMLQMMGQQSTNENGEAIHQYNFELTKEGNILLNGADISALQQ